MNSIRVDQLDHILRPRLPWRDGAGARTECGLDGAKASSLTREEYFARLKDLGQQRCAMLTCMTCANTAARWGSWEDDPREALGREISWEGTYMRGSRRRDGPLRNELLALASLAESHKEQFAALVKEMADRDEWINRKEEARRKPTAKRRSKA